MVTAGNEEKKQFLWGYRDSLRRIERIKAEMEELRAMKTSMASGGGSGCGRKGYKNDLSGRMARLDALEADKKKELCHMMEIHERIERAINSLENEQERDVLFYRYIKGLTWLEIAEQMGYTERQAHRFHGKALAHLDLRKDVIECQC